MGRRGKSGVRRTDGEATAEIAAASARCRRRRASGGRQPAINWTLNPANAIVAARFAGPR
jgi:hypothetical protein